jgi:hypothetical protein
MDPNFEKANEIYFRLGIIYKQQQKFQQSLEVHIAQGCHCQDWILANLNRSASATLCPTLRDR